MSFIEEQRKLQIIAAAIRVLARDGYAKASLSRIATEAGISKSIITYHFSGKDEMFEQVFETIVLKAGEVIGPYIEAPMGAGARVEAYIRQQLAYMGAHRDELLAIGVLALNHGKTDGPDYIARSEQEELQMLEAFFAEGQASGEFRMFDRRVMAATMSKAIEGALTEWAWRPDTDLAAYANELVNLFDRAMRKESP